MKRGAMICYCGGRLTSIPCRLLAWPSIISNMTAKANAMINVEGSYFRTRLAMLRTRLGQFQDCAVSLWRVRLWAKALVKWAQRALVKPTATPSVLPARSGLGGVLCVVSVCL